MKYKLNDERKRLGALVDLSRSRNLGYREKPCWDSGGALE